MNQLALLKTKNFINAYLDNFDQTPGVYFIKDGKKHAQLLPQDAVQQASFDAFVKKYQLDKK